MALQLACLSEAVQIKPTCAYWDCSHVISAIMSAIWRWPCDKGCCTHSQVRTAWKVWRTWSNGGGETGLRFDDSIVQKRLATGLVDSEKVSCVICLTPLASSCLLRSLNLLLLFFPWFSSFPVPLFLMLYSGCVMRSG